MCTHSYPAYGSFLELRLLIPPRGVSIDLVRRSQPAGVLTSRSSSPSALTERRSSLNEPLLAPRAMLGEACVDFRGVRGGAPAGAPVSRGVDAATMRCCFICR